MTASAQIVGTTREIPDSRSPSLLNSGKSIKSDFHIVFEQCHASREGASAKNDSQGAAQQKQKTADWAARAGDASPRTAQSAGHDMFGVGLVDPPPVNPILEVQKLPRPGRER